jgi:hypothetical protein
VAIVKEIDTVEPSETQSANAESVMYTQKVIGLEQSNPFLGVPGSLFSLETPTHEKATPTIGTRIAEYPKGCTALRRMLSPFVEAQSGIERCVCQHAMTQCAPVELEFEYFPALAPVCAKQTKAKRFSEPIPIGVHDDDNRQLSVPSPLVRKLSSH